MSDVRTFQPTLVGVLERELPYSGSNPAIELNQFNDTLRLDERTQKAVVLSGELALLCSRVHFAEWSKPDTETGTQMDIGRAGVEVSFAKQVNQDGTQL